MESPSFLSWAIASVLITLILSITECEKSRMQFECSKVVGANCSVIK